MNLVTCPWCLSANPEAPFADMKHLPIVCQRCGAQYKKPVEIFSEKELKKRHKKALGAAIKAVRNPKKMFPIPSK